MIDERSRPYSYAGDDRVNQAITGRNIGGAGHTPQLRTHSDTVIKATPRHAWNITAQYCDEKSILTPGGKPCFGF